MLAFISHALESYDHVVTDKPQDFIVSIALANLLLCESQLVNSNRSLTFTSKHKFYCLNYIPAVCIDFVIQVFATEERKSEICVPITLNKLKVSSKSMLIVLKHLLNLQSLISESVAN